MGIAVFHGSVGSTSAASRSRARIDLRLLGQFGLVADGDDVALPFAGQRLVAYLAIEPGSTPRRRVAGTLWPDANEGRAAASLRTSLWRVREGHRSVVETPARHLALSPTVRVDVGGLLRLMRAIVDEAVEPEPDELEDIIHAQDLLVDWSEEWLEVPRARFREARLHALERVAQHLVAGGRFARAIEVCQAAIASDPLRESPRRQLIQVHLAEGNGPAAMQQFEAYRAMTRAELGIDPSPAMTRLLDTVALVRRG